MLDPNAFDFLFLAFGLICLFEFKKIIKLSGYYIFIAFMFLWWFYIYLNKEDFMIGLLLLITLLVNLFLISNLYSKKPLILTNAHKFIISLFYIGGGCLFLTVIPYHHTDSICQVTDYRNFYSDLGKRHVCLFGRSHLWKKKAIWKCFSQKNHWGIYRWGNFFISCGFILAAYEDSISLWKWLLLAV